MTKTRKPAVDEDTLTSLRGAYSEENDRLAAFDMKSQRASRAPERGGVALRHLHPIGQHGGSPRYCLPRKQRDGV